MNSNTIYINVYCKKHDYTDEHVHHYSVYQGRYIFPDIFICSLNSPNSHYSKI